MKTLAILFFATLAIGTADAQSANTQSQDGQSPDGQSAETQSIDVRSRKSQPWSRNFGMNYGFTMPTGGMKQNIRYGNGLSLNLLFEDPSHRLAAGVDFSWTGYGHSKSTQDYTFPDNTVAPMNVVVNNSLTSIMATTRLYLLVDGPVRPYATVKAGYMFFNTKLTIIDPDNADSCEPVEKDILSKDGTMVYSAGGGVRIDAGWLFKKAPKGVYYIDLGTTMTQGGRVSYMNEDGPDPGNPSHNNMSTRVQEVEGSFINTQTQVVHAHHVGYLYNSFVQMMDFRLGLIINFGVSLPRVGEGQSPR